jgi:hypothetical protein
MATRDTHLKKSSRPAARRKHRKEEALDALKRWRNTSLVTTALAAGALPLARGAHASYGVGITTALVAGALLALVSHLAREVRLAALVADPDFAHLPGVARKRRRVVSARNRRQLALGLRRSAAPTQPPPHLDPCPVLRDRVARVRPQLLELACLLEQAHNPDPTFVALVQELLRDGASPLYNPNVPADDLYTMLNRARFGLNCTNSSAGGFGR